jgi:hypothetical protein
VEFILGLTAMANGKMIVFLLNQINGCFCRKKRANKNLTHTFS